MDIILCRAGFEAGVVCDANRLDDVGCV
eukprot:COSAG06_NODE_56045_length_286_cov_1.663102_1_plen_27_part_01